MAAEVDLRIASDPRWLRLARIVVKGFCREFEFEDSASRAMVSALDEALSNVMRHAYCGDTTRPIRIACRRDGDNFEVEVSDRGREFDPFAHPLLPPDELRSGGRGIFLIRSSVDECEYVRDGEWNRLRLRKRLPRRTEER
jgi:serine/threonine-protein kinase RsbW